MRPLHVRFLRNLRHPLRLVDWATYQLSRGNDVYLSTLPSSGTHWLRFLIAKGLVDAYDLDHEFTNIRPHDIVPGFRNKDDRFVFNDQTHIPRVQHTHKSYSFLFRGERVILLVRDLRDTMVSSYDTYSERIDSSITFSEFLRAEGVDETRHRTLEHRIEFLNRWARNWERLDDHLCIKYEELKTETKKTTRDIFEFIGIENVSTDLVERAVRFSSIEHMKYIEQYGETNLSIIKDSEEEISTEKGQKINEGTTGRYNEYFDESDREYFQKIVNQKLENDYGYNYKLF